MTTVTQIIQRLRETYLFKKSFTYQQRDLSELYLFSLFNLPNFKSTKDKDLYIYKPEPTLFLCNAACPSGTEIDLYLDFY